MRSPSEKGPDPANQVKIKKKEDNKGEGYGKNEVMKEEVIA
jgi:hypothetical protein